MANAFANTQDLVAIEELRGSTVIVKGGSLRQVLIVGGVNFSLQIIIHSRKINIERYLASLDERKNA